MSDIRAAASVTIGVSLEPIETIMNLGATFTEKENVRDMAQGIARDLFRFMESFRKGC